MQYIISYWIDGNAEKGVTVVDEVKCCTKVLGDV